ncbi:DUF2163 domain-containing protein [Profundibacterium mesophilum]|uniref:Bacteriophage phiJL001 Gp84 C-terminal domain-containing protein n=1 Tax=Profundibacterium mesophilum KAUST100406-0324 TaxID=1037889 RepID=A0A921NRL9_9RHOB|nr:DUF2163 domain-containing protein [Profundibacterium mesophilum]KAF0677422.1 hypothetical protein PMES_00208 [Profundibacterium mesophilum KAUST100406-0324]
MTAGMPAGGTLDAHLAGGVTTVCRCWFLERRDGFRMGFTDHDAALRFEGMEFRPHDGLSGRAIEQTSGLSVDNGEVVGILSGAALEERDILSGRFDGAALTAWSVNWADPAQRAMEFRGTLGEITRNGNSFAAELRGLSDALAAPTGRVYQAPCGAVLGDARCGVELSPGAFCAEVALVRGGADGELVPGPLEDHEPGWFAGGRAVFLDGACAGQTVPIRRDRQAGEERRIELWQSPCGDLRPGDRVRLLAGCDKDAQTCAHKFGNIENFQGFPHLPGDDWLMAVPDRGARNDGGSLVR